MTYRDPYRHYRRQMRRAFRGRRGGYPVPFPVPYEPLGWIALAAFSRWAYRNRSAFLPLAITTAAFLTAANLHSHHRRWWITIAAVTTLATFLLGIPHRIVWTKPAGKIAAGLLARAWEKRGIDRPTERIYGTAIIAATGGWLAAATAISPLTKPLPLVAGIAGSFSGFRGGRTASGGHGSARRGPRSYAPESATARVRRLAVAWRLPAGPRMAADPASDNPGARRLRKLLSSF
jgi:hypothetical protein